MIHRFSIGIVLLLLTGSTYASAYNEIPTVAQIQLRADSYVQWVKENEEKWQRGAGGVAPPPDHWNAWTMAHREALLALVSGRLASFLDQLQKLEEMGPRGDRASVIELAELYSLAVEVGVTSIEPNRFTELLAEVRHAVRRTRASHHGGPKPNMDDSKRVRMRSNFAYSTGDLRELRQLYDIESADNDEGAAFIKGYIAFLIAKLEQSEDSAFLAINQLQPFMNESEDRTEQVGTVSLYLGTAYLILASSMKGEERRNHLDQATLFAKQARQNLELLDVPVMWGVAMSLTADVLAMEHALAEPGSKAKKLLNLESNRAHDLSIQYH